VVNVSDNDAEDANDNAGILAWSGSAAGYEAVSVDAIQQTAPPLDQLLADFDVGNTEGGSTSIRIEVTGHFENNADGLWPAQFTATANDVTGSPSTVASYIGSSAYDQGEGATAVIDETGALFAVSNFIRFNPNSYWITHVYENAAGPNTSASGSADFLAPIPVPAAGFLLLGALGGLAAVRRRKG
jgi:hypothetical protein